MKGHEWIILNHKVFRQKLIGGFNRWFKHKWPDWVISLSTPTPFKAAPAPQSTLAAPLIEKGTESDWFRDFQRKTRIWRRSNLSIADRNGFAICTQRLFSIIIPKSSSSLWAAWMSASIFTIFADKVTSRSRLPDLALARANRCPIIISASLPSCIPAGDGMRSLMAQTYPISTEVDLFWSRCFSFSDSVLSLPYMCQFKGNSDIFLLCFTILLYDGLSCSHLVLSRSFFVNAKKV